MLTQREIANQEIATYQMQKAAQDQRIETEKAKGTADMQADLAKSQVGVDIKPNNANRPQGRSGRRGGLRRVSPEGGRSGSRTIGLANAAATRKRSGLRHRLRSTEGSTGRDRHRARGGGLSTVSEGHITECARVLVTGGGRGFEASGDVDAHVRPVERAAAAGTVCAPTAGHGRARPNRTSRSRTPTSRRMRSPKASRSHPRP